MMISEAATSSAVTFQSASSSATWKDPGPDDFASAISEALLYSNDAEIAATSGSATGSYVAVTAPSECPAPVIFVIIALPPGKRNTRSPSVTRSTAPETATAPAPTGEYFAR